MTNADNFENPSVAEGEPQPPHPLESRAAALNRLRHTVGVNPAMDDLEPGALHLAVDLRIDSDGEDKFYASSAVPTVLIDPSRSQEERLLFSRAQSYMWEEPIFENALLQADGRWWAGTRSEKAVDNDLLEVMMAGDSAHQLDVLNCSSEILSPEEAQSIEAVLSAVASYTGSKIFDRVSGIVFIDDKHTQRSPEQVEDDKHIIGSYQNAYGVITINLSYIRQHAYQLIDRYKTYFEGTSVDLLQVVLAHELGHAMDIRTFEELDAHHIDKSEINWGGFGGYTDDFSAFQKGLGWKNEITQDEKGWDKNNWSQMGEDICEELPPTNYATDPREDFAETFAVLALGGDSSELTVRQHKVADSLNSASGNTFIGPRKIELHKKNQYELYLPGGKLKKVNLLAGQFQ